MSTRDTARFDRTVLTHMDAAYTLARYLVGDEHDAQDVVQEAALRAFTYFDGFRGGEARAWFLAIVRNCARDWVRVRVRDRRTLEFTDRHVESIPDVHTADASAIAASERARIAAAMAELPPEFTEVIVLREIEGLSYKEISAVAGVPIGTVMSRLARGRQRLAAALVDSTLEAG
jgi:RNA polymerase sigma-70 factor (ECF subfamily)